ncbi:Fasciclin-domain-containing protein [Sanghuangporus baumii]|uniref:Fasciclin-domain-containing protein n=1 Tax=Sanghuangporus baumii TaxID=108892 RepID=A0A9Q5NCD2_SANBA|nr:Fasciclin-domain-containing protein [Sanghuangporus baumii]
MRFSTAFSTLALLAAPVASQNTTFLTELVQQLQSLGLTSFINASTVVNQTSTGQSLLAELGSGPQTVFAPNNDAWAGALPNVTSSAESLTELLSYHVVPGTFNTTATYPNTTIGRTLLNSSDVVFLEGNKRQVLAWSDLSGTVTILNQNTPNIVVNSTTVGNITVHVTTAVIDYPGDLEAALFANNLTSFTSALQNASLLDTLNRQHGVTIFAPSDAAFAAAQQNLSAAGSNATVLTNVLRNHVINGTTVYSGNLIELGGSNVTTGAGEGLSATFNSTGGFVTVGNSTAGITTPDIVLWNGVLHIVDSVLLDGDSDESAASSAVSSANAAATSSTTESGPIGFTPTPTSAGNVATGSSSSSASSLEIPLSIFGIVLAGALGI